MPSKQLRCCQLGSKRFSLKQMQVSIFPSFAKRYKRNKKSLYLPAIFFRNSIFCCTGQYLYSETKNFPVIKNK